MDISFKLSLHTALKPIDTQGSLLIIQCVVACGIQEDWTCATLATTFTATLQQVAMQLFWQKFQWSTAESHRSHRLKKKKVSPGDKRELFATGFFQPTQQVPWGCYILFICTTDKAKRLKSKSKMTQVMKWLHKVSTLARAAMRCKTKSCWTLLWAHNERELSPHAS